MSSETHMAREIAKKEMPMENKKKRRYVQQQQPQVRKQSKKYISGKVKRGKVATKR